MSFFDHFWALFPLARTPTQKSFPQSHFTVYNADFFLWPPFTQWHGWLRERSSIQFFFFLEHSTLYTFKYSPSQGSLHFYVPITLQPSLADQCHEDGGPIAMHWGPIHSRPKFTCSLRTRPTCSKGESGQHSAHHHGGKGGHHHHEMTPKL